MQTSESCNKKENTIQQPFGVLAHKTGAKQGVHIDLLTPWLSTKEGLQPQLNVQSVVGVVQTSTVVLEEGRCSFGEKTNGGASFV